MTLLIIFLVALHRATGGLNTAQVLELVETNHCGNMELCLGSTDYRRGIQCQCDPNCSKHGDCCRDSPFFRVEDVSTKICKAVSKVDSQLTTYVSMVGSCPPEWQDKKIRENCVSPKILGDDPLSNGIPMTDTSTTIPVTYRNAHCAVCNNADLSSLSMWRAKLKCNKVNEGQPTGLKSDLLQVSKNNSKKWSLLENGIAYTCVDLIPVLPPGLENLRRCPHNGGSYYFYNSCPLGWKNTTTETLCKSYTAYTFLKKQTFQNVYCAQCRRVGLNMNTTCYPEILDAPHTDGSTGFSDNLATFQELLDFELQVPCEKDKVFDPFAKRCRRLFNVTEKQSKFNGTTKNLCATNTFVLTNETYLLSPDNGSIWLPAYGQTYGEGEFFFVEGNLTVCLHEGGVTGIRAVEGALTYIGLGISIIFLTLHLCAVALVEELRNLSGRTLASLCVALLLGYLSFILAGFLGPRDKPFCMIASVSIYYFFLSAFAWMLVIAFDVWRALAQAVHFQSCRGGQWCRFFAYSAFAWLTPSIMSSLAIAADNVPESLMNEDLRPGFGVKRCWFSHRESLMIFFGAPLSLIMILNIGFFTSAALMTMGTRPCGMSISASGARRDFRLYLRLAVMVGLTWVVGLLANVLNNTSMWFVFVILNTLQGLFIFVMFTCTGKVFRGLGRVMPWTESLRYSLSSRRDKRSTKTQSCTGASNDTLQDSAFGSSSDKEQNSELHSLFAKSKIGLPAK